MSVEGYELAVNYEEAWVDKAFYKSAMPNNEVLDPTPCLMFQELDIGTSALDIQGIPHGKNDSYFDKDRFL